MTLLGFTGLINAVIALALGLFIFLKNPKPLLNKAYINLNLSIALYSIGYFLWQSVKVQAYQIYWFKVLTTGIILVNPAFLYFAFVLTNKLEEKKKILITCYILSGLFILLNMTSLLYTGFVPKHNLGLWPIPSILFHVYLLFWFWQCFYGLKYLIIGHNENVGLKREQIRYCAIAAGIGFFGGATNWPMWYNIFLPPYLNILVAVHISIVAYAIFRYRLMDIEVIIKKTLVYAGLFTFAYGVIVAVAMLIAQLLGGTNNTLALAISALVIAFTLRPVEIFLTNTTNKYLFQKKYEYKQILKGFIEEVITVLNLDEVVNSTLKLFDETLHPYAAGIFILNKVEGKYQLYNSYGLEDKNITFTSESKLITFLKQSRTPAIVKQINGIVGVNPGIVSEMAKLKAVIVLPLALHADLIGFISLGKKKSDEEYTKDDLDVLLDLAGTESIAVANSQLLQEVAQNERRAAIGTMAAGINHEIGNPLNIMSTKIQVFKLAHREGTFKDMPVDKVLDEAEAALDACLQQSARISEITKKLSNFAKPSKDLKVELVVTPQEMEVALYMASHDLNFDKIDIKKEISSDSNKIFADGHEMQQTFFNLIRNAVQAIEGPGTITIRIFSTTDNKVRIEIEDTGKGIPEDKKHRIFEPFFTTKGTKGTGLGLSIVRELVRKNKGEISFKSKEGVGTTFILEFPKGA